MCSLFSGEGIVTSLLLGDDSCSLPESVLLLGIVIGILPFGVVQSSFLLPKNERKSSNGRLEICKICFKTKVSTLKYMLINM